MIIIPSGHQNFKGLLVFFILIVFTLKIFLKNTLSINRHILFLFLFFIFIGLVYGIYGLIRGNLGVFPTSKEIIVYPIFYFIIINLISNYNDWEILNYTIIFSSLFLSFYIIATIANSFGILPDNLYLSLETDDSNLDVNTDAISNYGRLYASFSSLPMLMFLQPYLFNYIIANEKPLLIKLVVLPTFILMTIIMCLVGRRILLIVALLFPFIIYLYHFRTGSLSNFKMSKYKIILLLLSIIILPFLIVIQLNLDIDSIFNHFLFSFQLEYLSTDGVYIENVRVETFNHLITKWIESPLFGFGSGAHDPEFYRDINEPWNYELFYVYFLFCFGLLGMLFYGFGIYYICKNCLLIYNSKSIYSTYALSSFFGMISFLVGSATNPYLLKFESLLVIFIPVMIINLYKNKML